MARVLVAADLLILSGPLGAGKTFFVRGLARALGFSGERVTSPTFALVQEFPTTPRLVHADLYRLSAAEQVRELGLLQERAAGALLVVEWGEPYIAELGGDALCLQLSRSPSAERGRSASLSATGASAAARLQQIVNSSGLV
jgi:tRNA threonylcarbamoyladenosine biosynthesis protein TsaE